MKTLAFFKNKYLITFIALLAWLLFFDKNDILSQIELNKKLKVLQDEKQYYIKEIAQNTSDMKALKTDPQSLEKFAREKYLMKKDNEEIFVIVTDTTK